jgi:uncharacterized membrane protein YkoI
MVHHGIWSLLLLMAVACPAGPPESPTAREQAIEVTREQAIEIARQEVSFQPDSVEAVLSKSRERPVWRVTFRGRLPGQPPGLFETMIVEVDAYNGSVLSISRT